MKTLVIHPADHTTDFLIESYMDNSLPYPDYKDGYTVVRDNMSVKDLRELIRSNDRIVMMGHGYEDGLYGHGKVMIGWEMAQELKNKLVIAIWCNADGYFKRYGLKGVYTGMIISEMEEALHYCIPASSKDIDESNTLLAQAIKLSLDTSDVMQPHDVLDRFYSTFVYTYGGESSVLQFNSSNIYRNL